MKAVAEMAAIVFLEAWIFSYFRLNNTFLERGKTINDCGGFKYGVNTEGLYLLILNEEKFI